eukprot:g4996.t1
MKYISSPWEPSVELLDANPEFRSLWDWISNSLGESVVSKNDTEKLKAAKLRYLIKHTLREELHEFNMEGRNRPTNDHEGRCQESLHHSLMVAEAMQSLRLSSENQDSVLGLTPKELVHRIMDIHRCQTMNQELIPKFQLHLDDLFDKVIGLFSVHVNRGENLEESILKLIEMRNTERVPWSVIQTALIALMEAHDEIKTTWETTAHLLEHHVLGTQLQKDKERLQYQDMLIRLHKAHAEFLHLSILNECYTPEAIQALSVVKNVIDQELKEALHELQNLKDQLEACKKLGPEYCKLATEYSVAKENLRQAKQTLKDIEDMEDDLDTMSSEVDPRR